MDQNNTVLVRRRGTRSVIKVPLLVAEWFSFEEMKVLQGVSVLTTSVWAKEWQYKDILNDIDGLVWEDLSEDSQKIPVRGWRKSCLVKSAPGPQEVPVQINRTGAQPRSVPHQVLKDT